LDLRENKAREVNQDLMELQVNQEKMEFQVEEVHLEIRVTTVPLEHRVLLARPDQGVNWDPKVTRVP